MKLVTRDTLTAWLDQLAQQVRLVAPRDVQGICRYAPVTGSADIAWDYARPKLSAKEFVFPSTHCLLTIDRQGAETTVTEPEPDRQVLFGLRPCDARGIAVLDAVFVRKPPVDADYARRRAATTLVGLACPQMGDDCFCNTVGSGPDDASALDVMLTQVPEGYAVQVVTPQGEALVAGLATHEFPGAPAPAAVKPAEPAIDRTRLRDRFKDRYWDQLAERCLGCRICAYVCPTCRCFDVRDEQIERRTEHTVTERLRAWDSCTGANYRVVAGGANPRKTPGMRLRNRMFCKLDYLPEDYGVDGCVGCGRCIESCPVNIDIVEVRRELARGEVGA